QFMRQCAPLILQLLRKLFQIHSPNQLHRNEIYPSRFAKMVSLDNVRVDQVRNQLCLPDKILDELLLIRVMLPDNFDRYPLNKLPRAKLFRLVNDSHPALENLSDDLVTELALDGEKRHIGM